MKPLVALMILFSLVGCRPAKKESSLIGIWQDLEYQASGWSNTYQFFPDGHYIFHYSTMDCAKREISHTGQWRLNGSKLNLTIVKRKIIVGGHFEEALGSCASKFDLVDGKEQDVEVTPAEQQVLDFKAIESVMVADPGDEKKPKHQMLRAGIGRQHYWKFEDDPDKYEP